jgi:hypothetical protein
MLPMVAFFCTGEAGALVVISAMGSGAGFGRDELTIALRVRS